MSKRETDIVLIRKYLNGELDTRAMHQLERRAQDDPFLMDALEGYQQVKNDQQTPLDELGSRLQQRVTKKERRIIPWKTLSIAASILVLFIAGGLWLNMQHKPEHDKIVAAVVKPEAKTAPAAPADTLQKAKKEAIAATPLPKHPPKRAVLRQADVALIVVPDKAVTNELASADVKLKEVHIKEKDTTPLNEMVVMGMTSAEKKAAPKIDILKSTPIKKDTSINRLLTAKVSGVMVNEARGITNLNNITNPALRNLIIGRVIARNDGLPLPGVMIKIAGTTKGAVTDADGKFKLNADSGKQNKLVIAYIGYKTREVTANSHDSLKTIALEPNSSSLSEVVVVGYGSKKDEADVINARPRDGWSSFRKYLKENAKSPDGKKGVVKLSFMVDHNGNIDEIKVTKGLSALTDQKAIDLIDNGPDWTGNSTGQPEKITIRIKFQ